MGAYRLSVYLKWQLGFLISIDDIFITIDILCFSFMICHNKNYGKGINLFDKWFRNDNGKWRVR